MKAIVTLLGCALILGGCGGATEKINTAEGFWIGTDGNGNTAALVVTEDGQSFGISSSGGTINRGIYGSIVDTDSAIRSGSGRDFDFSAHTVSSITYGGTAAAKSALAVNTSSGFSFSGVYRSSYDQTANLAQIAGTYSGSGVAGVAGTTQAMSVTIGADGTVTVTVTGTDCAGTGSAVVSITGKNVFSTRIAFSGSSCALGNATTIGVVALDRDVTPARAYVLTVKNDMSDGFFWSGT
jgi:hypothetical protein